MRKAQVVSFVSKRTSCIMFVFPYLNLSCLRFICIANSSDQKGLRCEPHVYDAVTWPARPGPSRLNTYNVFKRPTVQTVLWSLKSVIQINLKYGTAAVWNLNYINLECSCWKYHVASKLANNLTPFSLLTAIPGYS